MYIAQVAEMLGVTTTMVRQWEKHGLIRPKRTSSGFRVYHTQDLGLLQKIRDLVRSGVNPAGIRMALDRDTPHSAGASPGADQTTIGTRLHRLRRANKMSLRELGAATKLSASHISALERSLTHPSVAVLQRLAAALGTNMISILGGEPLANQLVVKPEERRPLDVRLKGIEIQQLYRVETVLESLMFLIEPGANSGESYQHEGEEFLFIISGTFTIVLDEAEEFVLRLGDSMTFASHRPHRYRNDGDTTAVVLWINTPPTF